MSSLIWKTLTAIERAGIALLCGICAGWNVESWDSVKGQLFKTQETFDTLITKLMKEAESTKIVELTEDKFKDLLDCNSAYYEFFYDELLNEFYDTNGHESSLYDTVGKYILSIKGWPGDKDVFYLYYPYLNAYFRVERLKGAHEIAMKMRAEADDKFLDCKPCGKKGEKL